MRLATLLPGVLLLPLTLSAADPLPTLSKSEVVFIQNAAIYNLTEVKAAEIALKRGLTDDEKTYAQELVRQHTQANQELATLARLKHVQISTTLPSDQQEELAELGGYPDADFNERFLEDQIDCHQKALGHLDDVSAKTVDDDLRRYAISGLVAVQQHLEAAKRLEARY